MLTKSSQSQIMWVLRIALLLVQFLSFQFYNYCPATTSINKKYKSISPTLNWILNVRPLTNLLYAFP